MFSVIIPLYNKAAYIEKAIQSVLSQTYQAFELIVVNDGSTDDSMSIVRNCQVSTVNCQLIDQANSGVSTARNNGAQVAKYDYIAFLDADDWWAPTYLEEMKGLIERYPDAGLYSASFYQVKNGRERTATIGVDDHFTEGYIDYCEVYAKTLCMPVCTDATIIPKKVFVEQEGFKPHLKLGEDFDLWIRVALKYPVALLNKHLAYYNHDVETQHRAVTSIHLYRCEEHYIFNLAYLQEEECRNTSLKRLLDALRVYVLLPYYVDKTIRKEARKELSKVNWKNQPFKERIRYHIPICLVRLQAYIMQLGSEVKQQLRHRIQ
jgi:glycosyltransferase involved in cell wall biosynthesis